MTIRTTLQYVAMLTGELTDWKNPGLKFVCQIDPVEALELTLPQ